MGFFLSVHLSLCQINIENSNVGLVGYKHVIPVAHNFMNVSDYAYHSDFFVVVNI